MVRRISGFSLGIRHLQTFLLFLCYLVNTLNRQNVSIAVVAMTNANTTNPNFPEFKWTGKQKSYILSSFYWGYILTQFIGAFMCRRFGAKPTMFVSTLGSSFLSLLTPILLSLGGWEIFCGIRMLQGMFQGLYLSCMDEQLATWSPVEERTRLGVLSHTGMELGNILSVSMTGLIAESSLGWPGISYIFGGLAIIWCLLWAFLGDNSPSASRFISPEEKNFILSSQQKVQRQNEKLPIPWRAILTSVPFISLFIVRMSQAWGFQTLQSQIPTYMNGVLHMNIKSNALFSALPHIAMFFMMFVYLGIADYLLKKKILSLTSLRKTFNSIAMWVPTCTLIGVGFLDAHEKTLAIILMTVTLGFNAGDRIGSGLTSIDLSQNHTAVLIGLLNTVGYGLYLLGPLFVGAIVNDESNASEWRLIFTISALVFFFGNFQYLLFGSTKRQPWDYEEFMLPSRADNIERYNELTLNKSSEQSF